MRPCRSSWTAPRTTTRSTAGPRSATRRTRFASSKWSRRATRPSSAARRGASSTSSPARGRTASTAAPSGSARDDALDASNVKGQDAPKLSRDQWGGTLGGPIKKDRAFFFGSFERLDETRGVNIDRSKIPAFVLAGAATPGGVEDFSIGPETGAYTFVGKGDLSFSDHHRLSITGNGNSSDITGEISSPVAGTQALPSAAATSNDDGWALVGRDTYLFGSTTFLESTAGYLHQDSGANQARTVRAEPILLLLLNPGFLQTGAPFGGRSDREPNRFQISQTLSHFKSWHGDHQFKAGWDFNRVGLTGFNEVQNDVEYSAAFINPNANAINASLFQTLGFAQSAARFFTLSANPNGSLDLDITSNATAFFGQDTWQVSPNLTLNTGLRYDYDSLFGGDKNNISPRLGAIWDVAKNHRTLVKANWGLFFDRNLLSAAATVPEKGGVFTRSAFDVALPRLGSDYTDTLIDLVITSGFPTASGGRNPAENPAYRTFADGLRARIPWHSTSCSGLACRIPRCRRSSPRTTCSSCRARRRHRRSRCSNRRMPGTDWEFFNVPGGSILGNQVLSFFPRGPLAFSRDVSVYDEDRTPWTNAFNAGVDQQLGETMSVSAMYVHRRSHDLLTRRIVNLFDVPPGNANFGQTTDGGPRISQVGYDGHIDYDGIVLVFRRRFVNGYQFGVSYTGSRARDNLLTGNVGSTFSNNNHPEIDYGPSNQSVPHIFTGQRAGDGAVRHLRQRDRLLAQRLGLQPARHRRPRRRRPGRSARHHAAAERVPHKGVRGRRYAGRETVPLRRHSPDQRARRDVQPVQQEQRASVSNVAGPSFGTPTTYFPGARFSSA